jgi:hypothetical protein
MPVIGGNFLLQDVTDQIELLESLFLTWLECLPKHVLLLKKIMSLLYVGGLKCSWPRP